MKKIISIIAAFILITAVILCGGVNKEANQKSQNTNEQKTVSSDNQKAETKKEFFDMKYIYKGIRADKSKFDEELKNARENNEYAKRNFDFLNRKFANDDERKKYSIEFISIFIC